jgi:hypothetical protein
VNAIRGGLIQSSFSQLRDHGYFERYKAHIDPSILQELTSTLVPSWVSIDLAHAHFSACDALSLSQDEMDKLGQGTGQRVRQMSLVLPGRKTEESKVDLWSIVGQLHRGWARVYQGGSVQVVKLGPKEQLLEMCGFALTRHRYFRLGNLSALRAAYENSGIQIRSAKLGKYDPLTHDLSLHFSWW